MVKPVLAIAVDFGTTFSGLSYMPVGKNERFSQIDDWPGAGGKNYKVPTVVSYDYDEVSQKYLPKAFGFAAESAPANRRCTMFKMFLDVNDDEEKRQTIAGRPDLGNVPVWVKMGKSIDDLIGDFLQLLYEHMHSNLWVEGLRPEDYDYNTMFTVPAQFEILEVEKFRSIVKSTGFGKHEVSVSLREPEAAALYTINHGVKSLMPVGQCIVLCDAGGGTVDIASYKVTQLMPTTKIEQINIVTGRPCGSMNIDFAFRSWLTRECIFVGRLGSLTGPEGRPHLNQMCKSFSDRKEAFDDSPGTPMIPIQVSPPYLSGSNIEGGYLQISREKMRDFFEESVSGTIECIREHVEKCVRQGYSIKSVFLVGGLGSSKYLHKRVKKYLDTLDPSIQVIKPRDAEYAVIRGAIEAHQQALLGTEEDPITVRICPASYGIRVSEPWDPERHDANLDLQIFNPRTKMTMARNQVRWLIKKGDKIHDKKVKEIKEEFHRNFEKSPQLWKDSIVMCNLDEPPTRVTKDVKPACCLVSDMTGITLDKFEKRKSTEKASFFSRRKNYYRCNFEIVMKIGLTDIEFQLWFKDKLRSDLLKTTWGELIL